MELFTIENYVAKPNVETLLISPFSDIWNRDKSPQKEIALKEFSYIEFMSSPRKTNPFSGYGSDVKPTKIIEALHLKDWSPDGLVRKAIDQYKEFFYNASPALTHLNAARKATEELQNFLENVDLSERNDKGIPVYKPKEISSAIADTFNIFKTLNGLEERVEQELYDATKTKGNREINHFER